MFQKNFQVKVNELLHGIQQLFNDGTLSKDEANSLVARVWNLAVVVETEFNKE